MQVTVASSVQVIVSHITPIASRQVADRQSCEKYTHTHGGCTVAGAGYPRLKEAHGPLRRSGRPFVKAASHSSDPITAGRSAGGSGSATRSRNERCHHTTSCNAQLVADSAVDPDGPKPNRLVQPDARRIWQRGPAVGIIEALEVQRREE